MKLQIHVRDHGHELQLERREDAVLARVDGRSYDLKVLSLNNGEYLLFDGTEVYECLVGQNAERRQVFEVNLREHGYEVAVSDPKRLRSGEVAGSHNHGVARILAPMPGKVVRVLVEVGSEVEAGAGIVVVEAMKMQNEMKAPKSGTVVSLSAEMGATVNAGEVLAVIE